MYLINYPGRIANIYYNVNLDTFGQNGLANTLLLNQNNSDSTGVGLGFNYASTQDASNRGQGLILDFSFPLIGVLNIEKFMPLFCEDLYIDLEIGRLQDFILNRTGTLTGFKIYNMEFVSQVITLSPESFQNYLSYYPDGIIKIKTQSYANSNSVIKGGTSGIVDCKFSKTIIYCSISFWWLYSNRINNRLWRW